MISDSNRADILKKQILVLPELPGIYQYFDDTGKIIYVGKAKNLKKRVSSYFLKKHDSRKTAMLVRHIAAIRHMVVETEQDALLLENNLIKKYQPRYNIRLKDDKTYPWIVVRNERFPRVFQTRNVIRDGSAYFGPYTSGFAVRTLLDLFKRLYKLRTCKYNLSDENVKAGKFRVCLEYHIGNCRGPCEGLQSEDDYNEAVSQIRDILKGNITGVIRYLREIMNARADEYRFEEAAQIKGKVEVLERFRSKSTVVSATITDVDVFGMEVVEKAAFVNYLKVINGAIVQMYTTEIRKVLDEDPQELLAYAIVDIRQKIFSNARELLVPFDPGISLEQVTFRVPERGDKKKLLELSIRNAKYCRMEKEKQAVLSKAPQNTARVLETIKKDLQLKELPVQIECFDNSNLQGTDPVAACVVFKNAKPAKSEYRHFHVKTVEGPNDFASMEEIVYRRYKRQLAEGHALPQLIIIDGGKGQLGMALHALEKLHLRGRIALVGIAKKLEELFFPDDPVPLYLDKNSETLKIIQQARDEAHRFGITFHRKKRSSNFIRSQLEEIPGIGEKTILHLLREFKSLENLKKQSYHTVASQIGDSRAAKIFEFFNLSR